MFQSQFLKTKAAVLLRYIERQRLYKKNRLWNLGSKKRSKNFFVRDEGR